MSKVRDNSAPKMILGVCWDARARSLAIPRQACIRVNLFLKICSLSQII